MKKYIALSVVTLFSFVLLAQEPSLVNIPSTQRLTFNSAIVGQEYDLLIHLREIIIRIRKRLTRYFTCSMHSGIFHW
jgi:hypothetical protein